VERKYWIVGSAIVLTALGYSTFKSVEAKQYKMQAERLAYENNMLLGEINIMESKPGYNDGYRDAVVKIGGPQSPGSYQDGWDAAIRVLDDGSYTAGYHTAIKQFGYTKEGNIRWMIEEAIPQTAKPSKEPIKEPKK
jgi:hypothetical protein